MDGVLTLNLIRHPSASVLIPALRTVGNIVTGDDLQTQVNSIEYRIFFLTPPFFYLCHAECEESCYPGWMIRYVTALLSYCHKITKGSESFSLVSVNYLKASL
jgi:hypothetical protein